MNKDQSVQEEEKSDVEFFYWDPKYKAECFLEIFSDIAEAYGWDGCPSFMKGPETKRRLESVESELILDWMSSSSGILNPFKEGDFNFFDAMDYPHEREKWFSDKSSPYWVIGKQMQKILPDLLRCRFGLDPGTSDWKLRLEMYKRVVSVWIDIEKDKSEIKAIVHFGYAPEGANSRLDIWTLIFQYYALRTFQIMSKDENMQIVMDLFSPLPLDVCKFHQLENIPNVDDLFPFSSQKEEEAFALANLEKMQN